MEYKWNTTSTILVAAMTLLAGAFGTYYTTGHNLQLEREKMAFEDLKDKRRIFEKRCDSMNSLHAEMTRGIQSLHAGTPDSLEMKVAILRAQSNVAHTFFGKDALAEYRTFRDYADDSEERRPLGLYVASSHALSIELLSCNAPGAYPDYPGR